MLFANDDFRTIALFQHERTLALGASRVSQQKCERTPFAWGLDAVLEGAVERSGDRVRVTVRLNQVSPEGQLWSNQYNRDIRDLLRLQDEIARAVTDEIQVKLEPQERAGLASSRAVDPEAQDD
jgi:TolB-like protein